MTETEETPVVAPKEEEVVKLSNSFKEACVLAKSELVTNKENSLAPIGALYVMMLWLYY